MRNEEREENSEVRIQKSEDSSPRVTQVSRGLSMAAPAAGEEGEGGEGEEGGGFGHRREGDVVAVAGGVGDLEEGVVGEEGGALRGAG